MTGTIADKIGITSIFTTVSIKTAENADVITKSIEWSMTDYALAISMIGGTLFAVEKIMTIYSKIKANRNMKHTDKNIIKTHKGNHSD